MVFSEGLALHQRNGRPPRAIHKHGMMILLRVFGHTHSKWYKTKTLGTLQGLDRGEVQCMRGQRPNVDLRGIEEAAGAEKLPADRLRKSLHGCCGRKLEGQKGCGLAADLHSAEDDRGKVVSQPTKPKKRHTVELRVSSASQALQMQPAAGGMSA